MNYWILVQEVVTHLNALRRDDDWTYSHRSVDGHPWGVITSEPRRGELTISAPREVERQPMPAPLASFEDAPGYYHHLHVQCSLPKTSTGALPYYNKSLPEANVSLMKNPLQIAKEILRRVIIPYDDVLAEVLPKVDFADASTRKEGEMMETIISILGIPKPRMGFASKPNTLDLRQPGYRKIFGHNSSLRVTDEDVVFDFRVSHARATEIIKCIAMLNIHSATFRKHLRTQGKKSKKGGRK
jgi:hypothetical protein